MLQYISDIILCATQQASLVRLPCQSEKNNQRQIIMADLKQEIQARQNEICELVSSGKNDDLSNFYTDDCKIMAPQQEIVTGKEGLKKLVEAMKDLQSKVGKTEAVIEEVFGSGDVVTTRGKGTTYDKEGKLFLQTQSLSVWKKTDGKWFILNHIWNTDKPIPS